MDRIYPRKLKHGGKPGNEEGGNIALRPQGWPWVTQLRDASCRRPPLRRRSSEQPERESPHTCPQPDTKLLEEDNRPRGHGKPRRCSSLSNSCPRYPVHG